MTAGLDPTEVMVGAANGAGIWVAPVGEARPATGNDAFAGNWESLGYLTEDAVKINVETDSQDIMAWQVLSAVDTVLKGKKLALGFTMMQAGGVNLGMYFDTTAPTVTAGEFDMDIPTAPAGTKYAVAIDTAYSGFILRFFFDRVTLKSNGEIGLGNAAAIPLPVELSCLDNSGILGSVQRTAVV